MKGITILIIFAVLGVLLWLVMTKRDEESFTTNHYTGTDLYREGIAHVVDRALASSGSYISISGDQKKRVIANIEPVIYKIYTANKDDKNKFITDSNKALVDGLVSNLQSETGLSTLPGPLMDYLTNEIPILWTSFVEGTIDYSFNVNTVSPSQMSQDIEDLEMARDPKIPTRNLNPISDQINMTQKPSYAGHVPKPVNPDAIVYGLNRGGSVSSYVPRPSYDPRGLSPVLLNTIANMDSAKDPHNLNRSSRYQVIDILAGGRGLCNEKESVAAINKYVDRVGDKTWETFRKLSSSFPPIKKRNIDNESNMIQSNIIANIHSGI